MCAQGANRSSMPEKDMSFRAMEDKDLVVAFKAGDPHAYDEMYRRYSGRVGGVCRRMLINKEDAQEAVQETFLKAYLALPEFNGNYRLGAWLSRIASNVCVDQIRARARAANVVPLYPEAGALAVEEGPEELVVGSGPAIEEQIGELSPLHARALMLRGVEGMSHREIAGRLSMSPSQVKALLHRARRSFKRSWDEAKGLVLAPIVFLRAVTRHLRTASQTGSQIAGATATVSPMLAERVATSAVIVAVALSGLPPGSVTPAPEGSVANRRPSTAEWQMTPPHVSIHEQGSNAPQSAKAAAKAPTERGTATRAKALPTLDKVLTRAEGTIDSPPKERVEDNEDDLAPIGSKTARRTLKDVVTQAEDLIGDL